jgi:hypothetical protein
MTRTLFNSLTSCLFCCKKIHEPVKQPEPIILGTDVYKKINEHKVK